jgi:hypothetical protein
MPRALVLLVTGVVWALMMAALVSSELIPYMEYQGAPTYRAVVQSGPRYELIRRGIFEGQTDRIGESTTLVYPAERGATHVVTNFRMAMSRIPQLGRVEVSMRSDLRIDAAYQLDTFRFRGKVLMPILVEGRREEERLQYSASFGGLQREGSLPFERGMTFAGSTLPQHAVGRPRPGMRWTPHMVDFDLTQGLKITKIYASIVDETSTIVYQDREIVCHQIQFRRDPTKELYFAQIWVDDEGNVLREQFEAFGYPYRIELEERREVSPEETARLMLEWK